MTQTSLSLLERAREDTRDGSWERLVDLYTPLLRGWLTRFDVQLADADDLVQEVLVAMASDLPQFRHSGRSGAFRSWLRTILVHRLRDFWRSSKYRPSATGGSTWSDQLQQLADEKSDASREWNLQHDQHVMARLMDQIQSRFEPKTWQAFHRQVIGGQRADVVAAGLGMPLSSVYVARSRVLSTLRKEAAGLIDEL